MKKRFKPKQIIVTVITIIIVLLLFQEFLRQQEGAVSIISYLIALIFAIGAADPIISIINWISDSFSKSSKSFNRVKWRKDLLESQQEKWIEAILNRSMKNENPIKVKFTGDSDFLSRIQNRVNVSENFAEIGCNTEHLLVAYKEAGKQLVILGEGGSGKTIALLQLLKSLLNEIRDNLSMENAFPILFHLGSWAEKQLSLEEWFVSELVDIFSEQPPIKDIERLVKQRDFVFLLDGFDEVPESVRQDLFNELQQFTDKGFGSSKTPFILCSRPSEYEAAVRNGETKRNIQAVTLKKVNTDDIEQYLGGDEYRYIREFVLEKDSMLYEPARRPFILNALATSYEDIVVDDINELREAINSGRGMIGQSGMEPVPDIILQRYIDQQFRRAQSDEETSEYGLYPEQTTEYLTWLAHKLNETSQNLDDKKQNQGKEKSKVGLLLDYLQPSWLDSDTWRWAYSIISRMFGATAIVMGIGFFMASFLDYLPYGMLAGIIIGILDGLFSYTSLANIPQKMGRKRFLLIRPVIAFFCCAIILIIPAGLLTPAPVNDMILNGQISLSGVTMALFISLVVASVYTTRDIRVQLSGDIQLVEKLRVESFTFLRFALIGGAICGIIIATFAQLLAVQQSGSTAQWLSQVAGNTTSRLITPLSIGFSVGFVVGALIFGAFGLLSISDIKERIRPNQGIKSSIANAIRTGFGVALFVGLISSLFLWPYYQDIDGIIHGIKNGLAIGTLGGLWYGGLDGLHHMVLRFFLYASGKTPLKFESFLDYCCQCNLIRDVGTSYVFDHDYLRLFFLSKPKPIMNWQKPAIAIILIASLLLMGISVLHPVTYQHLLRFADENQFVVDGTIDNPTAITSNQESICLSSGQDVSINSRGLIKTGNYTGYVSPDGTEVGIYGLPIGDTYDTIPGNVHSALMCKLDSEDDSRWLQCAEKSQQLSLPWEMRTKQFTAQQDGCFEFAINTTEPEKLNGYFFATVEFEPSD